MENTGKQQMVLFSNVIKRGARLLGIGLAALILLGAVTSCATAIGGNRVLISVSEDAPFHWKQPLRLAQSALPADAVKTESRVAPTTEYTFETKVDGFSATCSLSFIAVPLPELNRANYKIRVDDASSLTSEAQTVVDRITTELEKHRFDYTKEVSDQDGVRISVNFGATGLFYTIRPDPENRVIEITAEYLF